MVGGKDQRLGVLVVGIAARVLAPVLFAGAALEALFALFGMTVADKVGAAAVRTCKRLGEHTGILPDQAQLGHYRQVMVPSPTLKPASKTPATTSVSTS